jgi:hypothetical protein
LGILEKWEWVKLSTLSKFFFECVPSSRMLTSRVDSNSPFLSAIDFWLDPEVSNLNYLKFIRPTPKFIAALFIIAKSWNQPRCPPMNEWIKKT